MTISATYSPEDNKIRLYASTRLDAETYARVKAAGFAWAPKQELFVAPKWTPDREDLAIELAGEIEPEEMTLAERAQLKAERLDGIAHKRAKQANAFQAAANELSEAFYMGQPILVGHHSERKARKTQERMQSAMTSAVKASKAANYWLYRAEGVEHYANMKNDPRVRANRIKTLLAELRDLQRDINHANLCLKVWAKITADEAIQAAIDRGVLETGPLAPYSLHSKIRENNWTMQEARAYCIENAERVVKSERRRRWIEHILNRLSYERELLGSVPRFEGQITPVILQAFAREHGAHKPAASLVEGDSFLLESKVALPLHLADGSSLEMSADDWRDLMQSAGYEVPAKKDSLPPILNFKAPKFYCYAGWNGKELREFEQVEMTKAQYGKINADCRGTRTSICGEYRFKICPNPFHEGPYYSRPWVAVFLTDSKEHARPASYTELNKPEAA